MKVHLWDWEISKVSNGEEILSPPELHICPKSVTASIPGDFLAVH